MSEQQKMPEPFNREAVLASDINQKFRSYYVRDTPFQRFVKNEVENIGVYVNEFLTPQPQEPTTVFVGYWVRHMDKRLYVRATYEGLRDRIALARFHQTIDEEIPIWSYVCTSLENRGGIFFSHSPNYGLTLKDIVEAAELIKELEAGLRTYGLMRH